MVTKQQDAPGSGCSVARGLGGAGEPGHLLFLVSLQYYIHTTRCQPDFGRQSIVRVVNRSQWWVAQIAPRARAQNPHSISARRRRPGQFIETQTGQRPSKLTVKVRGWATAILDLDLFQTPPQTGDREKRCRYGVGACSRTPARAGLRGLEAGPALRWPQ